VIGGIFAILSWLVHNTIMRKPQNSIFLAILVVLLMILSFIMGRISVLDSGSQDITIISATDIRQSVSSQEVAIRASSRGSKYYFPWCVSNFNEENTIYFENEAEAENAGYTIATDCIPPGN
jgi:hypothetical protein